MKGEAELERLLARYASLEAAAEELATQDAIALHDERLRALRLSALVQRAREQPPTVERVAAHYEAELEELAAEARQLREENAALAIRGRGEDAGFDGASADTPFGGTSPASTSASGTLLALAGSPGRSAAEAHWPARSDRTPRSSPRDPCSPTATAAEQRRAARARRASLRALRNAREVWRCRAVADAHRRQASVEDWCLVNVKAEFRVRKAKLAKVDRQLAELRQCWADAQLRCGGLERDCAQAEGDLEDERQTLSQLRAEALAMREACVVPAQLKRKSNVLMKSFGQECDRLVTEKHLQGLQSAGRLYKQVALHAPSLQTLAGRAKSTMEQEFIRYTRLAQHFTWELENLHCAVAECVLSEQVVRGSNGFGGCVRPQGLPWQPRAKAAWS